MPNSPDVNQPQTTAEDSFLNLLVETLESLDRGVRAQFLRRYFKAVAQVELTEDQSLESWERILARRHELTDKLKEPVSLKTAMVDVLSSTNLLRVPILVEYDELKKLQVNAATDALTGLYNRRLFEEYFDKELNRSKRYKQQLALILMDLHRFKQVNDRYGHLVGDQALQIAAVTLRKTVRNSDYAFRIGGDEFALLLPQCDSEQCAILGRRLRTGYEAGIEPLKVEVPLALDYGIAVCPLDADKKDDLIRIADQRLYELKNSMRGQPRGAVPEAIPVEQAAELLVERPVDTGFAAISAPEPIMATAAAGPPVPAQVSGADKRKWERVSLVGTRAYAVLGDDPNRTVRLLDLSYGGVALQTEKAGELPNTFQAVLHVPIVPPVKVSLRKTYEQRINGEGVRVGCAFAS